MGTQETMSLMEERGIIPSAVVQVMTLSPLVMATTEFMEQTVTISFLLVTVITILQPREVMTLLLLE